MTSPEELPEWIIRVAQVLALIAAVVVVATVCMLLLLICWGALYAMGVVS